MAKTEGVDLNVNLDALQTKYDRLKETHAELAGQLAAVREELKPMKDIRYWFGKVLASEQEVKKKPEPKHSVTERLENDSGQEKQTESPHSTKNRIWSFKALAVFLAKMSGTKMRSILFPVCSDCRAGYQ